MSSSNALVWLLSILLVVSAYRTGQEFREDDIIPVDYTGSQLWRLPIEKDTLLLLENLADHYAIKILEGKRSFVDVLIKSEHVNEIEYVFKKRNILYEVQVDDLQKLINEENPPLNEKEKIMYLNMNGHNMTWSRYHRVDEIYAFLDYVAAKNPKNYSVKTVGKSVEGRDIKVLKISNGKRGNKAIWIDGGIHAREWISPAVVTYIINQFASESQPDEVKNIDWYIMPVVNPDGYEYTHTNDRLWRKNRGGNGGQCVGVDLNRNFGFKWGGQGTSDNPCSEIYRGIKEFSEPESKALADHIKSLGADFRAYLTYHSYGQYILYSWGYNEDLPADHEELQSLGDAMNEAIKRSNGKTYQVGSAGILLYPAAGASDDWAKSEGIKYVYTVELRDTGSNGFVLPASQILPTAKESLDALKVVVSRVTEEMATNYNEDDTI